MSFMNMLLIFSTLGVLKLERSRAASFSQSASISRIDTTFFVSKEETSRAVRLWQPLNIILMSVT